MAQQAISSRSPQLRLGVNMGIPALFTGDIIATASASNASGAIRWATDAPFSHAILCLNNELGVDSMPGEGVTKDFLNVKLKGASKAAVFRHRTASIDQCKLAANWAAAQVGTPYDNVGAARVGLQDGARTEFLRNTRTGRLIRVGDELYGKLNEDGHDASFFCSELILRAFSVAGAPVGLSQAHTAGPGTLLHTADLVYMGDLQEVS